MKRAQKSKGLFFSLVLICLTLVLSIAGPVQAQTSIAVLSMSPTPYFACVGQSTVIYVRVTNVVDLQAYDISGSFTPANNQAIAISKVENAGWLTPSFSFFPLWDNTAGTFSLDGTKLGSPGMTGDGNLIKITFQAIVPGQTVYFTINQPPPTVPVLSDGDGFIIPYTTPAGYDGVVYTRPAGTCDPTAVELRSFSAERAKWAINLKWVTVSETDNLGFNIYRAASPYGTKHKVNKELIPTLTYPGSLVGSEYSYVDKTVVPGKVYYYWLQDVDIYGHKTMHGPIKVLKFNPLKR